MGLAGPKKSNKIARDPNNTKWTNDKDSFGHKMMTSQGWEPGQYLGAKNAKHAEFHTAANASHIRVQIKDDNLGLGAKVGSGVGHGECTGLDAFKNLLGRLNGKEEDEIEKEQRSRDDLRRAIYTEQRWGSIRFVRGGFLIGDKIQHLIDAEADRIRKLSLGESASSDSGSDESSSESEAEEETAAPAPVEKSKKSKKRKMEIIEDEEAEIVAVKVKKSKKRKLEASFESASESATPAEEEKSSKKKSRKERKSKSKSEVDVEDDEDSSSAKELKRRKKEKNERKEKKAKKEKSKSESEGGEKESKKHKKKSKREKEKSIPELVADISESSRTSTKESTPATPLPAESGRSTPMMFGRHAVRSRNIAQKRLASMDAASLAQIFMIKA